MDSAGAPDPRLDLPPRLILWRWLMGMALVLFVFNFWAIALRHAPNALLFEVPSRTALATDHHWWTVFTYVLTSSGLGDPAQWLTGPLSLLFLALAARLTEEELFQRHFLSLCAACAIGGALAWLPLHWHTGESLRAGCTVLVVGLGSFLCFALPDEPMPLQLFFTVDVRPQAFFWFVLALESGAFLGFELPQVLGHPGVFQGDFDHSAQIGAMLTGWAGALVWRRTQASEGLVHFFHPPPPAEEEPPVPVGARTAEVEAAKSAPANRRELREAVDRILDKINHGGFQSLSAQERQLLNRAKDILSK